ncbi:MAG: hypothetical protein Q9M48_15375 [Rhodobacterales bacterium]|nr:hypothetical protein [Rhodobacterales bacterium]
MRDQISAPGNTAAISPAGADNGAGVRVSLADSGVSPAKSGSAPLVDGSCSA